MNTILTDVGFITRPERENHTKLNSTGREKQIRTQQHGSGAIMSKCSGTSAGDESQCRSDFRRVRTYVATAQNYENYYENPIFVAFHASQSRFNYIIEEKKVTLRKKCLLNSVFLLNIVCFLRGKLPVATPSCVETETFSVSSSFRRRSVTKLL